jgi:hypothetical protein
MSKHTNNEFKLFAAIAKNHLSSINADGFPIQEWIEEMTSDWVKKKSNAPEHTTLDWVEQKTEDLKEEEHETETDTDCSDSEEEGGVFSLTETLKYFKPKLKPASIEAYRQSLLRVHMALFGTVEMQSLEWLVNEQSEVIEHLATFKSLQTRRGYYTAICAVYMNSKYDKYVEIHEDLKSQLTKIDNSGVKSERMEQNWITMGDIDDAIEKADLQGKALIQMYRECPLRNDVAEMEVLDFPSLIKGRCDLKNNCYVRQIDGNSFLHLVKYKTDGKYGPKRIDLSEKATQMCEEWLATSPNPKFLFLNTKNDPVSRNNLTKMFNRYFAFTKKKVSSTIFRHVIVSSLLPPVDPEVKAQQIELADKMCHSLPQQALYAKH